MASCPLCSDVLLRHVRSGETYWFCRRCRVELLEKTEQFAQHNQGDLQSSSIEKALLSSDRLPVVKAGDIFIQGILKNKPAVNSLIK